MVKRNIAWEFYVISIAITLFILFMGIYLGIFLSKSKVEELENELKTFKIKQEDLVFELTLLTKNGNISCDLLRLSLEKTIDEAGKLGDKVSIYETTEKIKDSNFYNLKKDYTLTLIRYWLYVEELKKNCGRKDLVSILYFYSNKYCPNCAPQGTILSYIKQKYPQNLMVFAFDYDIDLNVIQMLKNIYNIKEVPTLIINGKSYSGLVTLEKLSQILCSEYTLC